MTTILCGDEDIESFVERLLENRTKTGEVIGEYTVGDEICTLRCKPNSTVDSLLSDYYSWLRTHNSKKHR